MPTIRRLPGNKTTDLHAVTPRSAVLEAIRLMDDKGIGAVLVMKGTRLASITERD